MRKHYVLIGILTMLCHEALPNGTKGYSLKFSVEPDINRVVPVQVTGTVTEETGSPFPGVNVLVKGTTSGVVTDANGKYSINAPDDGILVFSFIGYKQQEIAVGSRTVVDLIMEPDLQSLDEVVVTALGIEKTTKSLGYATTKVNSDQLTINRSPNLMNSLQGKIAGVNIAGLRHGSWWNIQDPYPRTIVDGWTEQPAYRCERRTY